MVVDMDATSIRVQREFDCRHTRMRNRGATFFPAPGLQGEGREMRGWDAWMGYLSYDSARDPSDVNGILSDRVCAAPVAHP